MDRMERVGVWVRGEKVGVLACSMSEWEDDYCRGIGKEILTRGEWKKRRDGEISEIVRGFDVKEGL